MGVILMNGLIKKKQFQRPSDMFKLLYKTNNKKKNKELVNMIKSGIIDSKNEIN